MRKQTVAVTGALGTLGDLLVRRLEDESGVRRIVLLDLVPPRASLRKAVFYRVDLTDPLASNRIAEALEREPPDALVHLAFLQQPTRDSVYEHALESVGTMHLLHAFAGHARAKGGPRLVVGSSTSVYGARPDNPNFLTEDAAQRGRPGYALVAEKLDVERQVRRFAEAQHAPVTVLRVAPVLGAGVRTLAGRYLSLRAVPTILGFNPLVQVVSPDDAVEGFLLAIREREQGHALCAYNVAASGVLPLHAVIRLCERRNVPMPAFAAYPMMDALFQAGASIAPGAQLDYVRYPCVADVERAARELGFRARQTTREAVTAFAASRLRDAA